ncbi:hypothetical protein [Streptomyces sp. NPDC058330]|uniref:hypothetical protein n=1 Tax=Streptomyces sp. NPDC058330 TaxID=3346449 RepID=UPI0036EE05B9
MTTPYMRPVEIADLISTEVQALLIKDVRHHWPHLTEDMGKRGVHQMVAFLATSTRTEQPLTPSLRVDAFWHALLQRTVPYVAFSRALGVDLIHHVPQDDGPDPESGRLAMEVTKSAIRAAGFEVDAAYWPGEGAAECTQCHAGCTDSPVNT